MTHREYVDQMSCAELRDWLKDAGLVLVCHVDGFASLMDLDGLTVHSSRFSSTGFDAALALVAAKMERDAAND